MRIEWGKRYDLAHYLGNWHLCCSGLVRNGERKLNMNDLELLEQALGGMAVACLILIALTLLGCIETVQQLRRRQRRKLRKTETERRLGRERL
jgi:hypothetical protein